MSTTLNELVREQLIAESPQIESVIERDWYVDSVLNGMTNVELLERISVAIEHGVRVQWLYGIRQW